MHTINQLLERNRQWSEGVRRADPTFFTTLSHQQAPGYMWIGCSDSRVPANQVVGLLPGEIFVHRNVANVVSHTDLNCLSTLQFAIDVLKVSNVIVCGHYGCGGVQAAYEGLRLGLIDNWLGHIRDVREKHRELLTQFIAKKTCVDRLCELHVIEQVVNVCNTTAVRDAWIRGQPLAIHGWIYGLDNGLIRDLGIAVSNERDITHAYEVAVNGVRRPE